MSTTPDPSPALTHRSVNSASASNGRPSESDHHPNPLEYDLSLPTAVSHLVQHLIQPLSPHYPHSTLLRLRDELRSRLIDLFQPTWEEHRPQLGSGFRSLICTKNLGLPSVLRDAAGPLEISESVWKRAIAATREREHKVEEWEAWCDPGQVVWRWGGWEWEDVGFEPFKVIRENFHIVWQAAATAHLSPPSTAPTAQTLLTPARASHAIPIRAPTVFAIPPTPAAPSSSDVSSHDLNDNSSPDLLPAFASLGLGPAPGGSSNRQPSGWSSSDAASSRATSISESEHSRSVSGLSVDSVDNAHDDHEDHDVPSKPPSRASHRGSESLSSVASSVSDSNSGHTQLLTPGSRPGSADPFGVPLLSLSAKGHDISRDRDARSRKITPPMLSLPRGRTPSPNTPDGQTITPNTENTITPSPSAPTPTVTPYDGGNVTVLGGGVKLGGSASRPASAHSGNRTPIDRSRSPSISLASRALSTALGPNSNGDGTAATISGGGQRKQRTRRRIMPTYLGHLGQPGVGGPIMGVFGQFAGKPTQSPPGGPPGFGAGYGHVGVGVAPPPIAGTRGVSMPRMG
ncbi:hypothetical protein IAR55_007008 [Kwoniella newhampshirensis]|uniref:Anti-proliferative protein domain-containing protein n=1 Tax=Kwoniella newhampshirensis TaxID=1651941 RepID=A0AAW0YDT8_9TREE